jgi:hypothetical protein
MTCTARFLRVLVLNILLTVDIVMNALLLGRPGETVSQRVGRLRNAGSPVGCVLCHALTHMFWFSKRDHCTWALDQTGTIGTELWRLLTVTTA